MERRICQVSFSTPWPAFLYHKLWIWFLLQNASLRWVEVVSAIFRYHNHAKSDVCRHSNSPSQADLLKSALTSNWESFMWLEVVSRNGPNTVELRLGRESWDGRKVSTFVIRIFRPVCPSWMLAERLFVIDPQHCGWSGMGLCCFYSCRGLMRPSTPKEGGVWSNSWRLSNWTRAEYDFACRHHAMKTWRRQIFIGRGKCGEAVWHSARSMSASMQNCATNWKSKRDAARSKRSSRANLWDWA